MRIVISGNGFGFHRCDHERSDIYIYIRYIRVLRPRFQFRTGHVTLGGSICTQLLSNEGWNPMYRLEQILVRPAVHAAVMCCRAATSPLPPATCYLLLPGIACCEEAQWCRWM